MKNLLLLVLLTFAAVLIHGYHPGVEDSEIYRAGIEKALHPELFPRNAEFFQSHADFSLYAQLIAASARLTHLPLLWIFLLWHLLSIFLLLYACWELTARVFSDASVRWAAVTLLACLLTIGLGGTGLYIMDEYLNPRNLAAFAEVFAIVRVLDRKYVQAALFLVCAGAIHPFMAAFAAIYCLIVAAMQAPRLRPQLSVILSPITALYQPPSYAYEQVIADHRFHYIQRWEWYELLGGIAPFFILWWFSRVAQRRKQTAANSAETERMHNLVILCRTLVYYGIASLMTALALDLPRRFETLARLQPMRMLFITYILLILFSGGLLAEYVLKDRPLRWALFFLPVAGAIFYAQFTMFPYSRHIEWPGLQPRNEWVRAFEWIAANTPADAVFALDPNYMHMPGEDENGFRAIAERSRLADAVKDRGVVTMFPGLAAEWLTQTQALKKWKSFDAADFMRLKRDYGVNWVVLQQPGIGGLDCQYQNAAVRACRIP